MLLSRYCVILSIFSPVSSFPSGASSTTDKLYFCKVRIMIMTIILPIMSQFLSDTLTAGWIFSIAKQTLWLLFVRVIPMKKKQKKSLPAVSLASKQSSHLLLIMDTFYTVHPVNSRIVGISILTFFRQIKVCIVLLGDFIKKQETGFVANHLCSMQLVQFSSTIRCTNLFKPRAHAARYTQFTVCDVEPQQDFPWLRSEMKPQIS